MRRHRWPQSLSGRRSRSRCRTRAFGRHRETPCRGVRLSRCQNTLAPPAGRPRISCFKDAAHALSPSNRRHGWPFSSALRRKHPAGRSPRPSFQHSPEQPVRRHRPAQGRIGSAGTAGDVGGDVDAGASAPSTIAPPATSAAMRRKLSTAPGVLKTVVFGGQAT